jgi:formamidopyrimidine-DNA glycosylase
MPEAKTIAAAIDRVAAGRRIDSIDLRRRDMLKTGAPIDLHDLAGAAVERVDTRGKYVVLHAGDARLVIQLGMAGRVRLAERGAEPLAHTHLRIDLADGPTIDYVNVRRIASGLHLLAPGAGDAGPLAALGPEADRIEREEFVARLAARRKAVKAALLDQSILAGLGNIYADESLARAAVRPTRRADRLNRKTLARLHDAVRAVLAEAIAAGGSTLADSTPFAAPDGAVGYFASRHRVYGRFGQPCLHCRTTLSRTLVAGRTTTYCPRCQS